MYFELDGTFPNHEANPLDPANLVDLQKAVVAEGRRHRAGLRRRRRPLLRGRRARRAGEPERGHGAGRGPRAREVARQRRHPQPDHLAARCRRSSPSTAGRPVRTRVGHSFIKQVMAETGAVFGGEHSAHYYFRDFWRADSGMLAALHVLAALGESDGTLSALMAAYERYAASGEVNSTVADAHGQDRRDQGAVRLARRRDHGRARRAHRRPARRLVVQPAPEQHRAAAAAQRRGRGRRGDGRPARRGARGRPRLTSTSGPRRRPVPCRCRRPAPVGPTWPLVRLARSVGGTATGASDGGRWQHRTSTGTCRYPLHDAARKEDTDGRLARPPADGDPGLPVRRPRAAAGGHARPTRTPTCSPARRAVAASRSSTASPCCCSTRRARRWTPARSESRRAGRHPAGRSASAGRARHGRRAALRGHRRRAGAVGRARRPGGRGSRRCAATGRARSCCSAAPAPPAPWPRLLTALLGPGCPVPVVTADAVPGLGRSAGRRVGAHRGRHRRRPRRRRGARGAPGRRGGALRAARRPGGRGRGRPGAPGRAARPRAAGARPAAGAGRGARRRRGPRAAAHPARPRPGRAGRPARRRGRAQPARSRTVHEPGQVARAAARRPHPAAVGHRRRWPRPSRSTAPTPSRRTPVWSRTPTTSARAAQAAGLRRALDVAARGRDIFHDPFADDLGEPAAAPPRLVLLATDDDEPGQAALRRTGRAWPSTDLLHPVEEVPRGARARGRCCGPRCWPPGSTSRRSTSVWPPARSSRPDHPSGGVLPVPPRHETGQTIVELLDNPVRPYAWGSRTVIAELRGEPMPVAAPGGGDVARARTRATRPTWSAPTAGAPRCSTPCAPTPRRCSGPDRAAKWSGSLPYLLKVLAADEPLSLQAHPSSAQAAEGFARENAARIPIDAPTRNYRDASHKPELICALTEFHALVGFREVPQTLALLRALDVAELAPHVALLAGAAGRRGPARAVHHVDHAAAVGAGPGGARAAGRVRAAGAGGRRVRPRGAHGAGAVRALPRRRGRARRAAAQPGRAGARGGALPARRQPARLPVRRRRRAHGELGQRAARRADAPSTSTSPSCCGCSTSRPARRRCCAASPDGRLGALRHRRRGVPAPPLDFDEARARTPPSRCPTAARGSCSARAGSALVRTAGEQRKLERGQALWLRGRRPRRHRRRAGAGHARCSSPATASTSERVLWSDRLVREVRFARDLRRLRYAAGGRVPGTAKESDVSASGGTKAIIAALLANAGIALAKFVGYLVTGSSSMLAESVHSVADTSNQGLLLLGGKRAQRAATAEHPFGYGRDRYFYSFVVALLLFSLGSVFAIYEGIHKLESHEPLTSPIVAVIILVVAIGLETLLVPHRDRGVAAAQGRRDVVAVHPPVQVAGAAGGAAGGPRRAGRAGPGPARRRADRAHRQPGASTRSARSRSASCSASSRSSSSSR